MRGAIVLIGTLCIAFVTASPLALERQKDEKPLNIVDVPAGIFEAQDTLKTETNEEPVKDVTPAEVSKDVEIVEPVNKNKGGESGEEGPSVFGFRFPSILIIRRPSFQQDPFSSFQSPFFTNFNRRPFFGGASPVDSTEQVDRNREPLTGQDSQIDEQKQNGTVTVNNLVQRMHQQINNLFANLFNPDAFAMPRPTFPRPVFSRPFFPPVVDDSAEFEDKLEFDKLPANYSNSTSETKMIDGQLVTVNKTVQKITGNNSNGYFHFSVIKVHPTETKLPSASEDTAKPEIVESETINASTPETKQPENPELDPKMNEVDRVDDTNQEKLSEVELKNKYDISDDKPTSGEEQQKQTTEGDEQVMIVPIKSAKLVKSANPKYSDLSGDIAINNLMANAPQARLRALFDPEEVEVFDV